MARDPPTETIFGAIIVRSKEGTQKENCWKLNGKPPRMGPGGGYKGNQPKGQVHLTNVEEPGRETRSTEIGRFNSEDIERLRNFLNTLEKPSGSCSFAQNGNTLNSYVLGATNKYISSTWVINSGATDHMTHFANWFTTYKPCPSNNKKKKSKLQRVH